MKSSAASFLLPSTVAKVKNVENVFYTGAVAVSQQANSAVDYLMKQPVECYIVVLVARITFTHAPPTRSRSLTKSKVPQKKTSQINYTPFGHSDCSLSFQISKKFGEAGKKKPVVSIVNGGCNVPFYKERAHKAFHLKTSQLLHSLLVKKNCFRKGWITGTTGFGHLAAGTTS
ncbi:ABC transporter substrate-binding protein [Vibrio chagasii]|nr:ABC transporter substrate-binding protein [Vibrio chagasii]